MTALMVSGLRCQFCHDVADGRRRVIVGDSGLICEECIAQGQELLRSSDGPKEREETPYLFKLLERHFAPNRLQSLLASSRTFPIRQQADLQLAG